MKKLLLITLASCMSTTASGSFKLDPDLKFAVCTLDIDDESYRYDFLNGLEFIKMYAHTIKR